MRAAVVGLGWWGKQITKSLADSSKIEVTHGVDPAHAGLRNDFDPFGVTLTDDYDSVLADPEIEAVIVATPNSLHEEQVIKAAGAGKQVFCEKPLALDVASARRMIDACEAAGIVLGMGHERRWEPAMEEVRQLVESGGLGKILHVETNFSHAIFTSLDPDNWRFSPSDAPGAGFTGRGIHLTDFMVSLFGAPKTVWATTASISLEPPREDTMTAHLTFPNDVVGLLAVMSTTPFYGRFTVFGDRGWVEAREYSNLQHDDPAELVICDADGRRETRTYPTTDTVVMNFEAWADAVAGKATYRITPAQILANIQIFEAIVTSARREEPVHIG